MWKGKRGFWIAAFLVCTLDLVTKALVFRDLGVAPETFSSIQDFQRSHHPVKELWGDRIRLVAMMNPGMMWGTLREYTDILLWFRMFAVLVILYLLYGLGPEQRAAQVALGAILGGALGNIHDSLRFVGVRDFLELDFDFPPFNPFPSFNVADSAICVGVAVLALGLVVGSSRRAKPA